MNLLVVYRALNWKMDCMRSVVCVLYLTVRMYEKVGFKIVDENVEEFIMVCEL